MAHLITPKDSQYLQYMSDLISNDMNSRPFGTALDIQYQTAYLSDSTFEDHSFLITAHSGTPVLGLIMSYDTPHDRFSCYGRSIRYVQNKSASPTDVKKAGKTFRKHIEKILRQNPKSHFLYTDLIIDTNANILTDILLTHSYHAHTKFYQVIDLSLDKESLWKNIRDSYKSLINWGLENIEITIKDASNITAEDFNLFRALHIKEAGRETRSKETWDIQLAQVKNNEAFLVMGYHDNDLISATFFMYDASYCYYGVSASRRDMFEKPLSHCLLWTAIQHAKSLECQQLEIGDILYPVHDKIEDDKKLQGISNFKRGFGGQTKAKLELVK